MLNSNVIKLLTNYLFRSIDECYSQMNQKSLFSVNGSKYNDSWLFNILMMGGFYDTVFNPSTQDTEGSRSMWVWVQSGLHNALYELRLHSKTFLKNKKIQKIRDWWGSNTKRDIYVPLRHRKHSEKGQKEWKALYI